MIVKSFDLFILVIAASIVFAGCSRTKHAEPEPEKTERKIIVVKIPPVRNEKLSAEERYWQMQKFLFPQITIPRPVPKGLPFDHSLFYIKLTAGGALELNNEPLANPAALEKRLAEIFRSRAEKGVYEPQSERVVKGVLVIAPDSAKYSEVFTLLEHIENSGAAPIVLQIGELPTAEIIKMPN